MTPLPLHAPELPGLVRLREGRHPFDASWALLLAGALVAVAISWYLRLLDVRLAEVAASVFVYGLAHLAASTALDRVRDPGRQRVGLATLHIAGVWFLGALWHLSGGLAAPAFLGFLLLTVPIAGFLSRGLLPYASALAASGSVALVALLESPELGWYLVRLGLPIGRLVLSLPELAPISENTLGSDTAAYSLDLCVTFAVAAFVLAIASERLAGFTLRWHRRASLAAGASSDVASLSHAVLNAASIPSVLILPDTGQIVQASESFRRRMLREREDLATCRLSDVFELQDEDSFRKLCRRGGDLPVCAYRLGPEARVARIEVDRVEHEQAVFAYVRMRDIQDLSHLEFALDRLRTCTLLVAADGRVLYVNRAAGAILGREMPWLATLSPSQLPSAGRTRIEISGRAFHAGVLAASISWTPEPMAIVCLEPWTKEEQSVPTEVSLA